MVLEVKLWKVILTNRKVEFEKDNFLLRYIHDHVKHDFMPQVYVNMTKLERHNVIITHVFLPPVYVNMT